jgi:hypothetical protein
MNLGLIFNRVANWNSKRYDRVYNHELSVDLLKEELQEWFDANSLVDQLDALCDLTYIAMGILWKIDVEDETLEYNAEESHAQVARLLTTNTLEPIYLVAAIIAQYENDNEYPTALAAQMVITLCMTQMSAMGLSPNESLASLIVVCDSNDSKSIKKTEAHIKANDGDKGVYFVPPEPKLLQILAQAEARYGN